MKPILYPSTETEFLDNGIGRLSDALSCFVTEELNGEYYLEMVYPVDGVHFDSISKRSIIMAKANPVSDLQPFRVYRISKPMNRKVKIYAAHIRQDLDGIPVSPFIAHSAAEAMNNLTAYAVMDSPFTFHTDKTTTATMNVKQPSAIKTLLYGQQGGILDVYGGEYEFNRFDVMLHLHRGMDRGVVIRYGKNLTDMTQEENCSNMFTGVYPFYVDNDGNVTQLPEKVISAEGNFDFEKYKMLDFSLEWDTPPTEEQLRNRAERFMNDNNIGVPKVSLKVSFIQLEQTEEYKGTAILERVLLGDTVSVDFASIGVSAKAKVKTTVYDCLLERYDNVSIGDSRASITQTMNQQQQELKDKPSKESVATVIANKLALAMGMHGGSIRFFDTNNDGEPDELYIADDPDPENALKVWRFNYLGWAASKTGYNGPFSMGATLEDGLLADFVTAAKLVAGTIQSQDGNFFCDLDNGIVNIKGLKVSIDTPALKVSGSGDVTASGSFTSVSGSKSSKVDSGSVRFYQDATEIASISTETYNNGRTALNMKMILNGIVFGVGESRKMVVNNGLNPGGRTEAVILENVHVNNHIYSNGELIFRNSSGANTGSVSGSGSLSDGTGVVHLVNQGNVHGDFYVDGDFSVGGYKNRVVETDNYGRIALYCVESASPFFCDMGSLILDENGYGVVWIDPVFSETVDTIHDYLVFSSSGEVTKHVDYFEVHGSPNVCIDWIVYYRQKQSAPYRLDARPAKEEYINPAYLEIDEAVFQGEDEAPALAELTMDEYPDTIESDAEEYLENYEKEIYGYDY